MENRGEPWKYLKIQGNLTIPDSFDGGDLEV